MAPTKKSRSGNKRYSHFNEVSPNKDVGNSNRVRQRVKKRKLSDMLGSQWSKEELQRFYEAYRKHGKDWKKVANVVRNRSIEMVEALYNMNRAYLSLPEGTASVAGLIAMMTDHYNVLESDSEHESEEDAMRISQKSLKRGRGTVQLSISKDPVQSQSIASSDGCLSLLKRRRSDGRAVGKRTPRFPVSYKKDNREVHDSRSIKGQWVETYANDDDAVATCAALTLTEASQRGGSPQVSGTSYRRIDNFKPSPVQSRERMSLQSKIARAEHHVALMDEELMEDSLGSKGAENGEYVKDSSSLMEIEGVGTVEAHRAGKKFYGKKEKVEEIGNDQFGDSREAYSGTEDGLGVSPARGIADTEVTNAKVVLPSPLSQRKRNKKLLFGDESSGFDALQTLADLSLMMPTSMMEYDSSILSKKEKITPSVAGVAGKSFLGEATSSSHHEEKIKVPGPRDKVHSFAGVEVSTSRKYKHGRVSPIEVNLIPEATLPSESLKKASKRKRKSLESKLSKAEARTGSHLSESMETQALVEEKSKSLSKGKHNGQTSALAKKWSSAGPLEHSVSVSHQKAVGVDVVESPIQVPIKKDVKLPTKQRSRRKTEPERVWIQKGPKSPDKIIKEAPKYTLPQDKALYLKEKLSSCLSSSLVRRWCTFEWFYSSIDYPWFAKNEFVEYLDHVGLGHIPRLTRVEWGVIRSSLGKPRRFSERFLLEEKEKLKQYRESVRKHYSELRTGVREGLPTDLARPLTVGQRVLALHPKSREVHDGSILTVDHDKCRVQFDRPEIGVEFVMDVDCMPSNPLENMPETLRRQHIAASKFYTDYKEREVNEQLNVGRSMTFDSIEQLKNARDHSYVSLTNHGMSTSMRQMKGGTVQSTAQTMAAASGIVNPQQATHQPWMVAKVQAREADIRALSDLNHALDKKVSSALVHLRQRNTYPVHSMPPWLKPQAISSDPIGPPSSLENSFSDPHEQGFNVIEIVKGSRTKAQAMVDAAMQALSMVKEGEDAFARIGEALYSMNGCLESGSGVSVARSLGPVNGSVGHINNLTSCTSDVVMIGHSSHLKSRNDEERSELQIPSELISSCVATLLMIQTCTERHYPPADVAQILDSAVTSLHPSCPQNLSIYREIQLCMGRIKTQILALIPT